jgi:hypothetical protein
MAGRTALIPADLSGAVSWDPANPEDRVEIEKVTDLRELERVANSNTRAIMKVQSYRTQLLRDDKKKAELGSVDSRLSVRQTRHRELIRRRETIKADIQLKKQKELEDTLKPTTDNLNEKRRVCLNGLKELHGIGEQARALANRNGQRRHAARINALIRSVETGIAALSRIKDLPLELDDAQD